MTSVNGRVVEVEFMASAKAKKNVDPEVTRQQAETALLDWLKGEFNKSDRDPRGFGAVVSVRVAVKLDGKT
jgi:hypothetical protein